MLGNKNDMDKFGGVLVQYFKLYPDKTYFLMDLLKTENLGDLRKSFIFLLLKRIGTEEAQDILLTVIELPEFSHGDRLRSAAALLSIKFVTMNSLQRLISTENNPNIEEQDVRNSVLLAVGGIANTNINPDVSEYALDYINYQLLIFHSFLN